MALRLVLILEAVLAELTGVLLLELMVPVAFND